jgi:hypothetical protein
MKDYWYSIVMILLMVVMLVGSILYIFNKGTWDRLMTNFNKDVVTAKDMIYQTGSVRVYRFTKDSNVCYLADKQGQGVSIYCLKGE